MAKKTFRIGFHEIGISAPVFIIAEAGVNHNGDPKIAQSLVREAKAAGADCVKFQTFKAESVATADAPKAAYQLEVTERSESQLEMLQKLELKRSAYPALVDLARDLGMEFMSTPYSEDDARFLYELGVPAFKIASGQIVELPFLEYVASLKKPMIISTGMATLDEVKTAVGSVSQAGLDEIILLQCTTNYPAAPEEVNLRAMATIAKACHVPIGFSDHTPDNYAAFAAVALGARVVEKHFTLDRNMSGPDHSSSLEPAEFRDLVKGIRTIEKSLGTVEKRPTPAEIRNSAGMRRSIVVVRPISRGERITRENLAFKRPATGLAPSLLSKVLGKQLKVNITGETVLKSEMVDWES